MRVSASQLSSAIEEELCLQEQRVLLKEVFEMADMAKFGGAMFNSIKRLIAMAMMRVLGVERDSFAEQLIFDFADGLTIQDIKNMAYGDEQCITMLSELSDALVRTMVDYIPPALGLQKGGTLSNALQGAFPAERMNEIAGEITRSLCEIDYGAILLKNIFD